MRINTSYIHHVTRNPIADVVDSFVVYSGIPEWLKFTFMPLNLNFVMPNLSFGITETANTDNNPDDHSLQNDRLQHWEP
ncbi:hypothetical protein [uncultured Bacteroides sp.]|uniref:hypothetical protein n=1 Tax=uncultured Bacteroides sp. TaxID=162156 RepID=UPI002617B301|nr:hypothetical protein [uncultured Bacteroides sp.]